MKQIRDEMKALSCKLGLRNVLKTVEFTEKIPVTQRNAHSENSGDGRDRRAKCQRSVHSEDIFDGRLRIQKRVQNAKNVNSKTREPKCRALAEKN